MGLAFGGVATPTCGVHPLGAVSCGVDVDADKNDVGFAMDLTVFICSADAFFEGDVFGFGDEEFCVITFVLEFCYYALGDFSVIDCFEEFSVWGAFAEGVEAVAGVEEDEHKKRELVVSRFPFTKI